MTYTPPATQEDLDRIIADRLSRQKTQLEADATAKLAEFDELKKKADEYDKAQAAAKTELQKAMDRAAAAEQAASALAADKKSAEDRAAQEKQVKEWADKIGKEHNVPADLLRGSTEDELKAHAEQLKPIIVTQRNGVVRTEGQKPTNEPDASERDAVRALFGTN